METIEIPCKDIQIIRVIGTTIKAGISETLQIKCRGKSKIISFPVLNDMFRFEQEMKSR